MTQDTPKFNVIPCTRCGQRYAGQGELVFDSGHATGAVCPPCANNSGPKTAYNVPTTKDTERVDNNGGWHDAITFAGLYGTHNDADTAMLNTFTRPELEHLAMRLAALVHLRGTYMTNIEDNHEWLHQLREHYSDWFD